MALLPKIIPRFILKQFQRTIEDFACEHCGYHVKGSGYTNHCPKCLYSKHVDVNPGDRANSCGGLMKPTAVETKSGEYTIIHRCLKCGAEKRNKTSPNDDMDEVIRIASEAG